LLLAARYGNRKLPAKPLSQGTFAGIPRAAKILEIEKLPAKPFSLGTFAGISQPSLRLCCSPLATEIENYRQNPSRMALLLVSPTFRMILVCPIGRDTHTTPDKKLIMPSRRPKITF